MAVAEIGREKAGGAHLVPNLPRLVRLGQQHRQLRDVIVPLHERADVTAPFDRAAVQVPHRGHHVVAVCIEDVAATIGVPGEVDYCKLTCYCESCLCNDFDACKAPEALGTWDTHVLKKKGRK